MDRLVVDVEVVPVAREQDVTDTTRAASATISSDEQRPDGTQEPGCRDGDDDPNPCPSSSTTVTRRSSTFRFSVWMRVGVNPRMTMPAPATAMRLVSLGSA